MRIALSLLLALHGAIHVLGFLQVWRIIDLPPLRILTLYAPTPGAAKSIGALWLVAAALLVLSAALVLLRAEYAWLCIAIAGVLSQILIVLAWPAAKAGTLVNVLLILPIVIGAARAQFGFETDRIVQHLFEATPPRAALVQQADLVQLPEPVQRWLTASGVVGQPATRSVRLEQQGWMRTAPGGQWMPTQATQYFTTTAPGFVWHADVRMRNGLWFAGRDAYVNGHGRMLIRALGVWPVVDASDAKIQQGTLLRYLGELVWFPSAALQPYIRWQPLDAERAQATITYAGVSATGVFSVDAHGQVTHFSAQRYLGGGPSAQLESWSIPMRAWKALGGVRIPTEGEVVWKLAGGDFEYYRFRIAAITYDSAQQPPLGAAPPALTPRATRAHAPEVQARSPAPEEWVRR